MKVNGIRTFLLWGLGSTLTLLMVVIGVAGYFSTQHEVDELFDAELAQYARMVNHLLAQAPEALVDTASRFGMPPETAGSGQATLISPHQAATHKYERKIAFQVWRGSGALLLHSASGSAFEPVSPAHEGYGLAYVDGHPWATFVLYDPSLDVWILTAQQTDVRDELSLYLALGQSGPLALALAPVLLLIWWVVRRAVSSIEGFSAALASVQPGRDNRIDLALPVELRPVQAAVNTMLESQSRYIAREKRFIAEVSHELRTPLSILAVHSRNLMIAQSLHETNQSALAIEQGVKRLSHLVNQLMAIEKLEQPVNLELVPASLRELVHEALAQVNPERLERVSWAVDIPATLTVQVEPLIFRVALRNWLDNAAKYAPQGSEVGVRADAAHGLQVCNPLDAGLVPDLARMGERFFRHAAHAGIEGSGLGLALSMRIMDLHALEVVYRLLPDGQFSVQVDLAPVLIRV